MKTETRHSVASAAFACTLCGARLDAEHVDLAADGSHCSFCGATQPETAQLEAGVSLDIGDALHDARLTRGETLEQASHFTHIQIPYLRALEHDQASAFDPFPGMTYARYFLRDYAEHLGIDPRPLVRRFDREVTVPPVLPAPSPLRSRRVHPGRWATGGVVVLIALLIASAGWSKGDLRATPAEPPASVAASRTPDAAAFTPLFEPKPAPPTTQKIVAVVRTTDRPSWMQAMVNGRTVHEKTVLPGIVLRYSATRTFELRLGDAGAVVLTINGRKVPTGTSGAVADLSFVVRDGRVVRV